MERPRLKVELSDGTTHEVTVLHQDILRAEQAAARMGLPALSDAPLTGSTMWAWAALKRMGVIDVKPGEFLNETCSGLEDLEDEEATPDVDPTQSDPDTDSAYDWQPTTPEPSLTG